MHSSTVLASSLLLGAALASPFQGLVRRDWPDQHGFNTTTVSSSSTTTTTTTTSEYGWPIVSTWPTTKATTDKAKSTTTSTTTTTTTTPDTHWPDYDWNDHNKPKPPPKTTTKTEKPWPPHVKPPTSDKPLPPPKTTKNPWEVTPPPKTEQPKEPWKNVPEKTVTVTGTVTVTVTEKAKPTGGADKPVPAPPAAPCVPSKPSPPTVNVDIDINIINILIEAYTFILVNPGHPKFNETANKFLHKDFTLKSGSINALLGKAAGAVTFGSLTEFISSQSLIAPLPGFSVEYYHVSYTEKKTTLTLKWTADKVGSAVEIVSGFIDLDIVLVGSQWTIIHVEAEFNVIAFLLNFGGKCDFPSKPTPPKTLIPPPSTHKPTESSKSLIPPVTKPLTSTTAAATKPVTTTLGWDPKTGPFN